MTKRTKPHEDSCRCRGNGCLARRKRGRDKRRQFLYRHALALI